MKPTSFTSSIASRQRSPRPTARFRQKTTMAIIKTAEFEMTAPQPKMCRLQIALRYRYMLLQ
jgi:hypothetical protein